MQCQPCIHDLIVGFTHALLSQTIHTGGMYVWATVFSTKFLPVLPVCNLHMQVWLKIQVYLHDCFDYVGRV